MSLAIFILVSLTFFSDMILTYNYMKTYKEMYPKNDWTLAEANPILRSFMKTCGLVDGMIYGAVTLWIILLVLLVIANENWRYFLFGLYSMVNIFHFVNWQALKRLRESKGGKRNGRRK